MSRYPTVNREDVTKRLFKCNSTKKHIVTLNAKLHLDVRRCLTITGMSRVYEIHSNGHYVPVNNGVDKSKVLDIILQGILDAFKNIQDTLSKGDVEANWEIMRGVNAQIIEYFKNDKNLQQYADYVNNAFAINCVQSKETKELNSTSGR